MTNVFGITRKRFISSLVFTNKVVLYFRHSPMTFDMRMKCYCTRRQESLGIRVVVVLRHRICVLSLVEQRKWSTRRLEYLAMQRRKLLGSISFSLGRHITSLSTR